MVAAWCCNGEGGGDYDVTNCGTDERRPGQWSQLGAVTGRGGAETMMSRTAAQTKGGQASGRSLVL